MVQSFGIRELALTPARIAIELGEGSEFVVYFFRYPVASAVLPNRSVSRGILFGCCDKAERANRFWIDEHRFIAALFSLSSGYERGAKTIDPSPNAAPPFAVVLVAARVRAARLGLLNDEAWKFNQVTFGC